MKKLSFITFMLLTASMIACGQKNVPQQVNAAFTQKYPSTSAVKWDNETSNEWEAEFTLNGKEMTASFDNSGKWLESETEIKAKELPEAVHVAVSKQFNGYKMDEISILDSPDLKGFEVGLGKGESNLEVVFDNTRKILKKTDVSNEEKEEKDEKSEKK